jgi:hypothetical protein
MKIVTHMPKPKKPLTVDISRRALLLRLDRALRQEGRRIRVDRKGQRVRYLLVDTERNDLVAVDVDIEALARERDLLEPWERLEDD